MHHLIRLSILAPLACCLAQGAQLIVNGTFETGTLAGWTVASEAGSFTGSNFFALSAATTPQSASSTAGPESGSFYAVSDQAGPDAHALFQTFVVPGGSTVVLSFGLFVNNYASTFINPIGLDFTDGANQYARVDLLSAGASSLTTTTGVLRNFYLGADPGNNPHAYTNYSFDITSLVGAGGTFQLRFAEVSNQFFLNMGVDNVSIQSNPAAVPEPVAASLLALGLGALLLRRRLLRA